MRNLLTEWSRLAAGTLADMGVTDVVISPGSRNTPFLLSIWHEKRITCHSVIDERSAGFFALGLARVTQRAVALLCTSGTAPAHYFPAVIEASLSRVPLIVLSADRPHELQHCAAAQTVDQVKLFGDYVRRFFDVAAPDSSTAAFVGLRRTIVQAVMDATGPHPGPVHVNLRARKPLEPASATTEPEAQLASQVERLLVRSVPSPAASKLVAAADSIACALRVLCRHRQGVIALGPAGLERAQHADAIAELALATGYPIYAETASQLRFHAWPAGVVAIPSLDLLLRHPDTAALPTLVLQIGRPPILEIAAKIEARGIAVEVVAIEPHGWVDPSGLCSAMLVADVELGALALARAVRARSADEVATDDRWLTAAYERQARVNKLVEKELAQGDFAEGQAVACVMHAMTKAAVLVLGNSLAVREADTYVLNAAAALCVVHQRGTSGIECNIALAAGACHGAAAPTVLLFGDVSFLHDIGSLAVASRAKHLVIVVLQNQGGRIFEQLPIAENPSIPAAAMQLVTTPHALEFSQLANFAGAAYARVSDLGALATAVEFAFAAPGLHLLEVCVSPHGAHAQNQRLWAQAKQQ